MVAETGFEPAVFGIEARDFIHLNYSAKIESGWYRASRLFISKVNNGA